MLTLIVGSLLTAAAPPIVQTLKTEGMSPAERVLGQTLQGLVGRQSPKIWFETKGIQPLVKEDLAKSGVKFQEAKGIWPLVAQFKSDIKGAILYKLGTPSLSVANGLCGPMNAIAIDESLEDAAKQAGLTVLLDVRGMTEEQAFDKYRDLYRPGIIIEQSISKTGSLRDFAVKHSAFVMDTKNREFRRKVVKAFGPTPFVLGWGPDEYQWISDISAGGGTGLAADWCSNLSALESLPFKKLNPPKFKPAKNEDNVRYVAFVMSDGDNIQWVTGDFATNPKFYGSPLRGQFPLSWEMAPTLTRFAPSVLARIYATAKPTDDFVTGPGLPGYMFPHLQPDLNVLAKQTEPYIKQSGLRTLSFLNTNSGKMEETFPWLDLKDADAAIYKDYSPYHGRHGKILWHNGKPVVSYRFVLWSNLMDIDPLAQAIAKMPTEPRTNVESYALINVHAWSYGNIGGPAEAVRRTIAKLPPNTRVVTANQLIDLLKRNRSGFQTP